VTKKLSCRISLEHLFLLSPADVRNSSSVNDEVLNSHIIEVNFKCILLRSCLVHNYEIKSKRNGLMRFEIGEDSGYDFSSVGQTRKTVISALINGRSPIN